MASTKSAEYKLAIQIAGNIASSFNSAVGGAQSKLSVLGKAAGNVMKVAAAASAAAAAAVGAFAASSVQTGMEFDSAMSQVAATMGKTTDEIQELRDFAQQMGATTAFSATEAAEALNYMALAGYDADTSMSMLPNVLNLAAAGAMDLASASDMITDAQSALGLTLDQTTAMVDQMAATSSKTNTSVGQLGEAILTVGGTAQYMAGGTSELNAVLGVLADNGIKGSEGGTHLRNMLLKLASPTADATKLLNNLGVQVFDAQGNMRSFTEIFPELNAAMSNLTDQERLDAMSTLFNSRDIASATALLGTTAERWEELGAAIDGAWLNMASLTEALSDVGMDLTAMQSNLNQLGIDGDAFSAILSASGGNAEEFAAALLEAADAGTSYQDIVNALGGDLGSLQSAFDNTSGAAAAMAATQLDNLAGDITLFQSALEGAQIALSDQLTPSLREFVQFGSGSLSELTTAFQEGGLSGAMEAMGGILSDGLNLIVERVPDFMDAGMRLLGALGQGVLDNLPTITSAALTVALMLVNGLVSAFPALTEGGTQLLLQLALGIAEAVPELIPAIVSAVFEIVNTLTSPDTLTALLGAALAIILALGDGLIEALPDLIAAIPVIVQNLATALAAAAPEIVAAGVHLFGSLVSNLPAILVAILSAVPAIVNGILGAFSDSGLGSGLAGIFRDAFAGVVDAFPSFGFMFDGISMILDNIIGFIQNVFTGNWAGAWQNILGIAQGILTTMASAATLPMELLFTGIQSGIDAVGAFLQEKVPFLGAIFTGWASSISAAIDNIKAVFSGIIEFINNIFAGNWSAAWQNIQDIFGNLFGAIVNLAKAPINGVISAINFVLEKVNGISITIPDWVPGVGGKTLGFNLPTIPQLAEGGIVTGPTFLEAGEAGDEAIIPLSELWGNMQTIVADAIGGYTGQLAALAEQPGAADAIGEYTGQIAALAEQMGMADAGAMAMPISDLLADLVGDDEAPEDDDGGGDDDTTPDGDGPPPLVIYYQPHLHFEGGTPSREDIVEAGRISQEEFNRMAARWQKDMARLSLKE